jgi:hypothetical protein
MHHLERTGRPPCQNSVSRGIGGSGRPLSTGYGSGTYEMDPLRWLNCTSGPSTTTPSTPETISIQIQNGMERTPCWPLPKPVLEEILPSPWSDFLPLVPGQGWHRGRKLRAGPRPDGVGPRADGAGHVSTARDGAEPRGAEKLPHPGGHRNVFGPPGRSFYPPDRSVEPPVWTLVHPDGSFDPADRDRSLRFAVPPSRRECPRDGSFDPPSPGHI